MAGEDIRAVLIANSQGIPESSGDNKDGAIAFTFQEGIGCDGGSHPHFGNGISRDGGIGINPENVANPLNGSIFVAIGIFGEEFVNANVALGRSGDNIGKSPPAIDPEVPAMGNSRSSHGDVRLRLHLFRVTFLG